MQRVIPDCNMCTNYNRCLEKGFTVDKYPIYCLEIKNGDEIIVTEPGIVSRIFRPPK